MRAEFTLDAFLVKNRITHDAWERAAIDWATLQEIASDHDKNADLLGQSAEFFARKIQKFEAVHSVRWRVKAAEHLLEKIIRKRADGIQKYLEITAQNYHEIVTDLVGVRALHLFKEDCFLIDEALKAAWLPAETPVAYIRTGDELTERFAAQGFEIREHPAGYRSVHYVLESRPLKRKVITEVQVRTIFEEAWSEIDHKIRYPNFWDNELIAYYLAIFNRMAGSADEMGSFVRGLATTLMQLEQELAVAKQQKQDTLQEMEKILGELENGKPQDAASAASIQQLKAEFLKLKDAKDMGQLLTWKTALIGSPRVKS